MVIQPLFDGVVCRTLEMPNKCSWTKGDVGAKCFANVRWRTKRPDRQSSITKKHIKKSIKCINMTRPMKMIMAKPYRYCEEYGVQDIVAVGNGMSKTFPPNFQCCTINMQIGKHKVANELPLCFQFSP